MLILAKESHLPPTAGCSALASHFANWSLREPNTFNHRTRIHEASWDSYQGLPKEPTILLIKEVTIPHVKVFSFEREAEQRAKITKLCARDHSA